MRIILALVLLLTALPAAAQSRMFTDADLRKPMTWSAPPPSAETLQGLKDRAYVASRPRSPGPLVASTSSRGPSLGPWEWPEPRPDRRLDGSLLTDAPWTMFSVPYWPWPSYPVNRSFPTRPKP